MKTKRLLGILSVLFLIYIHSNAQIVKVEQKLKDFDKYIEKTLKDFNVPGLAVAVVKDTSIIFLKAYGVREIGKSQPVDEHTLFAIGSTTKAMTAAAVGLLMDEKKLNWDDPVTKYLPWFQLPDPWATREVTIRDLLCHRVGVGNALLPAVTGFDREEILHRFRYVKPYLPFRYQYEYNNVMYSVAGEVVAAVSGMSWEEFVQTRILNPLCMAETYPTVDPLWDRANLAPCFCCDLPDRTVGFEDARAGANVAMPHMPFEGEMKVFPWRKYATVGPAGGELTSNIVDMAKWLQLQVGKGVYKSNRLLSEAVFNEMHKPQIILPVMRPSFLKDEPDVHFLAYGFGWNLSEYKGRLMSWHMGGYYGFFTSVALLPEMNVGVVLLSNAHFSGAVTAVQMQLFDIFLGAPNRDWSAQILAQNRASEDKAKARESELEKARIKGTKPPLPLESYAGNYFDNAYGHVTIATENGSLMLRFTGGATGDLKHWHYNIFRLYFRGPDPLPQFVTFSQDPGGRVRGMSIEGVADFKRVAEIQKK